MYGKIGIFPGVLHPGEKVKGEGDGGDSKHLSLRDEGGMGTARS